MRESCDECPALEKRDGKDFCFYYQTWRDVSQPCGNSFEEKPEFTQDEYEEIAYVLSDKYGKWTIEELDRIYLDKGEWTQEMKDDIKYSVEKAKEEMRSRKEDLMRV